MTKYKDITCYNDFLINKKKSEIAMIEKFLKEVREIEEDNRKRKKEKEEYYNTEIKNFLIKYKDCFFKDYLKKDIAEIGDPVTFFVNLINDYVKHNFGVDYDIDYNNLSLTKKFCTHDHRFCTHDNKDNNEILLYTKECFTVTEFISCSVVETHKLYHNELYKLFAGYFYDPQKSSQDIWFDFNTVVRKFSFRWEYRDEMYIHQEKKHKELTQEIAELELQNRQNFAIAKLLSKE